MTGIQRGQENGDFFMNGDAAGDECDQDWDNDGFTDDVDLCPRCRTDENTDMDMDGIGDACDNCPRVSNPDQTDSDRNGRGDACNG